MVGSAGHLFVLEPMTTMKTVFLLNQVFIKTPKNHFNRFCNRVYGLLRRTLEKTDEEEEAITGLKRSYWRGLALVW